MESLTENSSAKQNQEFLVAHSQEYLSNKRKLFKRKCAKDSLCPVCDSEVETAEHMIFLCPWAKSVWFGCNIRPFEDLGGNSSVIKLAADMVEKLTVSVATNFIGKVAHIAWHVWKSRNVKMTLFSTRARSTLRILWFPFSMPRRNFETL